MSNESNHSGSYVDDLGNRSGRDNSSGRKLLRSDVIAPGASRLPAEHEPGPDRWSANSRTHRPPSQPSFSERLGSGQIDGWVRAAVVTRVPRSEVGGLARKVVLLEGGDFIVGEFDLEGGDGIGEVVGLGRTDDRSTDDRVLQHQVSASTQVSEPDRT